MTGIRINPEDFQRAINVSWDKTFHNTPERLDKMVDFVKQSCQPSIHAWKDRPFIADEFEHVPSEVYDQIVTGFKDHNDKFKDIKFVSTSKHSISKPFWVFAGNYYYARGGLQDFIGRFDTEEEACKEIGYLGELGYYQIVDVENLRLMRHYGLGGHGSNSWWPEEIEIVRPEDDTSDSILIHAGNIEPEVGDIVHMKDYNQSLRSSNHGSKVYYSTLVVSLSPFVLWSLDNVEIDGGGNDNVQWNCVTKEQVRVVCRARSSVKDHIIARFKQEKGL